jgi:hypothetical protein
MMKKQTHGAAFAHTFFMSASVESDKGKGENRRVLNKNIKV